MSQYAKMLSNYQALYDFGLCTMHHMHDSVLFINNEGDRGYEAIQFHNDGLDYRVLGFYATPAEAYSMAVCYQ